MDSISYASAASDALGRCVTVANVLPISFNKSLELWNQHRAIKEGGHVCVVEGFFGCMNLRPGSWSRTLRWTP
jgi:hypothetical protein